MKENRAACSREKPRAIAAEIVTPERETPGTSEMACAPPTHAASKGWASSS